MTSKANSLSAEQYKLLWKSTLDAAEENCPSLHKALQKVLAATQEAFHRCLDSEQLKEMETWVHDVLYRALTSPADELWRPLYIEAVQIYTMVTLNMSFACPLRGETVAQAQKRREIQKSYQNNQPPPIPPSRVDVFDADMSWESVERLDLTDCSMAETSTVQDDSVMDLTNLTIT